EDEHGRSVSVRKGRWRCKGICAARSRFHGCRPRNRTTLPDGPARQTLRSRRSARLGAGFGAGLGACLGLAPRSLLALGRRRRPFLFVQQLQRPLAQLPLRKAELLEALEGPGEFLAEILLRVRPGSTVARAGALGGRRVLK